MSIFDEMERDSATFQRAPTTEESKSLTELGLELVDIDRRLKKYAEVAKELMVRQIELQFKLLPDAMIDVGQDVIGLGDQGVDLILSDYFKAGLPNPDADKKATPEEYTRLTELRQAGIDFLTKDAPDILSTTVTVTLPKGSLDLAQRAVASLTTPEGSVVIVLPPGSEAIAEEIRGRLVSEQGYGLPEDQVVVGSGGYGIEPGRVSLDEGVHWATLTSYVKEQVRERKRTDLPLEALGATVGKIVKIQKRKTK